MRIKPQRTQPPRWDPSARYRKSRVAILNYGGYHLIRFALLALVALMLIPGPSPVEASVLGIQLKPEPVLGAGPGFIGLARDANGETEGLDTYLDFGVRLTNHVTVGIRDRQPPGEQWMEVHDLSLWTRMDLERYDYDCVDCFTPYARLSFGSFLVGPGLDEVASTAWKFAGGGEYQYSHLFSLFAEAEGVYVGSSEQIDELGLRFGGIFRFMTNQ